MIYIPLWFYFHLQSVFADIMTLAFTFHYGSIFIHDQQSIYFFSKTIYIPLWFYFHLLYYLLYSTFLFIYIPLWFYFHGYDLLLSLHSNAFTFHYGSIFISDIQMEIMMLKIFTFHYGSIFILFSLSFLVQLHQFTFHYGSIFI